MGRRCPELADTFRDSVLMARAGVAARRRTHVALWEQRGFLDGVPTMKMWNEPQRESSRAGIFFFFS